MTEEQTNRIHLSNTVVRIITEKRCLHSMYEDNDIQGQRNAIEYFEWLDQHAPGQFVLIDTGDMITPSCITSYSRPDWNNHYNRCQLYDADYYLYIVPMVVWNDCKDDVLKADSEWRERMNKCQLQQVEA